MNDLIIWSVVEYYYDSYSYSGIEISDITYFKTKEGAMEYITSLEKRVVEYPENPHTDVTLNTIEVFD